MSKLRLGLILFVGLLFAGPVWSADGDSCNAEAGVRPSGSLWRNGAIASQCIMLCDSDTASANPCTILDLYAHGGIPDVMSIEIHDSSSCNTGYEVAITARWGTGGDYHTIATLNATTTEVVLHWDAFPPRYFRAITVATGCADFDVFVHLGRKR